MEEAGGKKVEGCWSGTGRFWSDVYMLAHAVWRALDDDRFGVVHEAIEQCGSQGAIVIEDICPLLVGAIGGDDSWATLVMLADDLEEAIGAEFVDGQVTQFVDAEQRGFE